MGYTKSPSKNSIRIFSILLLSVSAVFLARNAEAALASQFSLSAGEEYNDNIFFGSKKGEFDLITHISPTLTILYAPAGEIASTLSLNIKPDGQIFARHGELNNFGENVSIGSGYTHRYSPLLSFHLSDILEHEGPTRTVGLEGEGFTQLTGVLTAPPARGEIPTTTPFQKLKDLVSGGSVIRNTISLGGSFLYAPDISFTGNYSGGYTKFLDLRRDDISNSVGVRAIYNWRQEHNLHAGYSVTILNSKNIDNSGNGENSVVHSFDVGDDYFSPTVFLFLLYPFI